MDLRKQLIKRSLSRKSDKSSPAHLSTMSHDLTGHDDVIQTHCDDVDGEAKQGENAVMELRRRVRGLEQRSEAERRQTELAERERERMKGELLQAQEQVSFAVQLL